MGWSMLGGDGVGEWWWWWSDFMVYGHDCSFLAGTCFRLDGERGGKEGHHVQVDAQRDRSAL